MFRIKICGITTTEDALLVAGAGADAVGLNFYPKSPRYLQTREARQIVDVLPAAIVKVGLFVNAPLAEICRTFDEAGLDLVQLHGDEPPDLVAQLGGNRVARAFRLGPSGWKPVADYLQECRRLGGLPRLTLIDSYSRGIYGGTGEVADWSAVAEYPLHDWYPPLVLAGGLTPDNVAAAIRTVRPSAVDTASGVESSPGRKSEALVRQFVEAARAAFDNP